MKIRITGCLTIAATLLAAQWAQAQNYSAAATACRTWTDLRASARAAPEMNWLEGYMMAAFDLQPVLKQHMADFSSDKLYTRIDEYCSKAPAQSLLAAAHAWVSHLIKVYSSPTPQ